MVTAWIDGPKVIFTVRHSASASLKSTFFVRMAYGSAALKAVFHVGQNSANLKALAIIRHSVTKSLPAELVVRHASSIEFKGITIIRHSTSTILKAILVVRHTAVSLSLRAEFRVTVEGWEMQGLSAGVYEALGVIS